jgi:hypothetical protein
MSGPPRAETALTPEAPSLNGEPRSAAPSPRNEVAAQMRRLAAVVVGRPLDDDVLTAAARTLGDLGEQLEAVAGEGKRSRVLPNASFHPQDFFPTSPMIGYASPIAPPVDFWAAELPDGSRELQGRAWFDYQYEGPPTCVHGGIIAELFDELLGSTNILVGRAGFTGTLTIRYRRPTPLRTELALRARQTGIEGRKIFAWGGIYHDGQLTAEADGIFIEVPPAQMASIVGHNMAVADGAVADPGMAAFVDAEGQRPATSH